MTTAPRTSINLTPGQPKAGVGPTLGARGLVLPTQPPGVGSITTTVVTPGMPMPMLGTTVGPSSAAAKIAELDTLGGQIKKLKNTCLQIFDVADAITNNPSNTQCATELGVKLEEMNVLCESINDDLSYWREVQILQTLKEKDVDLWVKQVHALEQYSQQLQPFMQALEETLQPRQSSTPAPPIEDVNPMEMEDATEPAEEERPETDIPNFTSPIEL
eukprot:TRINITY_DN1118_c0_g2_i1.p1 TRINITY_DN1118_c0_g2~~TRINITY_DN1118_c0_g2_i1.p1  ORF type:complete len:217 (-),score=64.72 TRINITY_DN1118_c0_g2_i1:39-689(-)